ncbi:MAG TPA: helix-turn-helix domain-containing protein [Rhodothermales bacterium]|nr:helix-turn-helix domain-containing protein [Rhodothermales bacterium]
MLSSGVHPARKLRRARILLRLHEGIGPSQIAREIGVHVNTVYNTRKKTLSASWQAALNEAHRSGRPPEISGEARAQITALACSDAPKGHSRWSLRLLADKAVELGFIEEISHQSVKRILKKTSSSRIRSASGA